MLDLEKLDHERLKSWLLPNPSYEIRKIQWTDIAEGRAFTALYNETNKDVPFQDAKGMVKQRSLEYFIERAGQSIAQHRPWIAYGLYDKKRPVGITLFEGRMNKPKCIYIEFTGIHRNFRGRGFGKYLKATTTLALMKEVPSLRYILTGNEESNAPMLQINRYMGFVPRSQFSMLRHIGSKES